MGRAHRLRPRAAKQRYFNGLLAERSASWNAKPETRHLPSLWEFLNIRLLTDKRKWTEPQRKIMRKAGQFHGVRSGLIGLGMRRGDYDGIAYQEPNRRARKPE